MLNPQPRISTHEPWILRQFAQQLPLDATRTGIGTRAASRPDPRRLPTWSPGEQVATNEAYQAALRTIGAADPRIVPMQSDPDSSTQPQILPAVPAARPIESVIAERVSAAPEQQMVAAAIALQTSGRIPFAAAFADSRTTSHDLIRMAAINGANIHLIGSHAAAAGDEDGASQLALDDIAMFRAIHDSTVLSAADANQTAALVEEMLDRPGLVYLRTLRMATPVIYHPANGSPSADLAL